MTGSEFAYLLCGLGAGGFCGVLAMCLCNMARCGECSMNAAQRAIGRYGSDWPENDLPSTPPSSDRVDRPQTPSDDIGRESDGAPTTTAAVGRGVPVSGVVTRHGAPSLRVVGAVCERCRVITSLASWGLCSACQEVTRGR